MKGERAGKGEEAAWCSTFIGELRVTLDVKNTVKKKSTVV